MHSSRMRTVRSSGRLSGEGLCLLPGGRGCLLSGLSAPGGVCLLRGAGSAPRGRCLLRGVSTPGGSVCSGGACSGGCLLWGGMVSQHALRQTSPRVDRNRPVKT